MKLEFYWTASESEFVLVMAELPSRCDVAIASVRAQLRC